MLTAIDDFIARGCENPVRGNHHRGLMGDPEDYGLPEPSDDNVESYAFTSDIVRCNHCTQPKYFTNLLLYETHMMNEHPEQTTHEEILIQSLQPHEDITLSMLI